MAAFDKFCTNRDDWYAIHVRAGRETTVKEKILANQRVNVVEVVAPEARCELMEDEPGRHKCLLGYMFVKFMMNIDAYHYLLDVEDVYRFLGFLYRNKSTRERVYIPRYIPETQINNVKTFLEGREEKENKGPLFSIGDEVEIVDGELSSVRGTVTEMNSTHVSLLSRSFFNQVIKVPFGRVALI